MNIKASFGKPFFMRGPNILHPAPQYVRFSVPPKEMGPGNWRYFEKETNLEVEFYNPFDDREENGAH